MCGVDLSTPADDTTAEGYAGCSAACASVVLPWVADCTASQVCVDADRSGDDCSGFDTAADGETECTALGCDHVSPATAGTTLVQDYAFAYAVDWTAPSAELSTEIQVSCGDSSLLCIRCHHLASCVCRACGASAD